MIYNDILRYIMIYYFILYYYMFAFNMWELACSPLPSGNWQSPSGTWHLPLETAICQPGTGIYQGGTRIYQVRSGILALTKCELAYWHTGILACTKWELACMMLAQVPEAHLCLHCKHWEDSVSDKMALGAQGSGLIFERHTSCDKSADPGRRKGERARE